MFALNHLDLTLPTPAENLACDEALLDWCEAGRASGVLRFWEPADHFVVLGYANQLRTEVNVSACDARNIPVYRRCSGGGTVLQGPGCLNYTLVLKMENVPALHSITTTNCFIMQRHREALAPWLNGEVAVAGTTDLALGNLKFSGNAQRRKRHSLLFHGTFLLDFDLALIEQLLLPPSKQPAYRQNRSHLDFLTRLDLAAHTIKAALLKTWNATAPLDTLPEELIGQLVRDKYAKTEWNRKW